MDPLTDSDVETPLRTSKVSAMTPDNAPSIPERKALRKRRRCLRQGIAVLEGKGEMQKEDVDMSQAATGQDQEVSRKSSPSQHPRLVQPQQTPHSALQEALSQLPEGFGEDFFLAEHHSRLKPSLAMNASNAELITEQNQARHGDLSSWLRLLHTGFSLLVHGVGSKRQVLNDFADTMLKPEGFVRIHIHAFDARFSLCECLRGVLERVYPDAVRQGTSADALGASVRAAAAAGNRRLCFIVHNIEDLPQPHAVIVSSMAASPNIHLVASVDNICAPLVWDSRCLKNFNFVRLKTCTLVGYGTETNARFARGLPAWSGLGQHHRETPKASLSLVLRSLTANHRELVQAMAERQLENDNQAGISLSALLKISTDQMIAATITKLRSLLNELRDHEVVVQRGCSNAMTAQGLFVLPFDQRTLEKLAEGRALESDDEGEGAEVEKTHHVPEDEAAM